LLSLATAQDVLERGSAVGPDIHPDASLREVLAELVWTGADSLPVAVDGTPVGRVTLQGVLERGRGL
jgi:osmoprotectant transport system ATP-binding protein